jgi:hypothetical protein
VWGAPSGSGLPFYNGRWRDEGPRLHGRCQCLGLKVPVTGVNRVRGCDYGQLVRGRVKRRKGRSLGLHGTGGREGRCPWRSWRTREAAL